MISPTGGAPPVNPFSLNLSTPNLASSIDSFAQQLATAIEGYLGNVKNGSHFEIDVQSGKDQSVTLTVKNLTTPAPPSAPTVSTPPSATPPASTVPPADTPPPADKSKMTPTDAYWAEQPPAVQALRYTPDDQRYPLAQDLAKQGYTIDVPIMVWGWDPLVTMTLRQNDRYTWVPSALQPNIPIGPGIINVWNLPSYNPNNPPPGSIKVSTDFAKGCGIQDPWLPVPQST